jgi:hypothetical protein
VDTAAAASPRATTFVKRAQGGSDFDLDRLVALCPRCQAQTDAPYLAGLARDHATRARPLYIRGGTGSRQVDAAACRRMPLVSGAVGPLRGQGTPGAGCSYSTWWRFAPGRHAQTGAPCARPGGHHSGWAKSASPSRTPYRLVAPLSAMLSQTDAPRVRAASHHPARRRALHRRDHPRSRYVGHPRGTINDRFRDPRV